MHWHNYQVSILVHISWVRNPDPDPEDESTRNIMQYSSISVTTKNMIAILFNTVYKCIGTQLSREASLQKIIG